MRALIIGAGIGGLTAALALDRRGIEVLVFDSVREVRPLGVGINLLPHGARELIELGLGQPLAESGIDDHARSAFTGPEQKIRLLRAVGTSAPSGSAILDFAARR
jgi:2-polyprenyl-6-methoxyphenol hydroxylase-like FAD-dependent oxidoreductase